MTSNTVRRTLQCILSLAVLAYLYTLIPFRDVFGALRRAQLTFVVMACLSILMMQVIAACRLKILTDHQGFHLPFRKIFEINMTSLFYKLFLPGGMIASVSTRFYKLQKEEKMRAAAFSAIVVDRVVATWALSFMGIAFWLMDANHVNRMPLWVLLSVMCFTTVVLFALLNKTMAQIGLNLAGAIPVDAVSGIIVRGLRKIASFRHLSLRRFVWLVVYSLLSHLVSILAYRLLGMSLGLPVGFITWGWIRAIVILLTMLPISIAGLGIRDAALFSLLRMYAVGGDEALAFAFLIFGVTTVFVGFVGGLIEGKNTFTH